MRWIIIFSILIFVFCNQSISLAATYYVDAAAANDSGDGSSAHPKKYIPSGIALLSSSGGDTLIIRNGIYSGSSNDITTFKAGTSGAYNTVQAETDGGVVITSDFAIDDTNNVYTNVIGLKFKSATNKYCAQRYVKFCRCAFEGGQICSSDCDGAVVYAAGSHQLYEDCWFYGVGGRYTVMVYEESNTVFRRCVARRDGGYSANEGNPEAVWSNYGSSNISYQNCIAIDNTLTYSGDYTASFYATGHGSNPASNNIEFIGCIDLNGQSASWYVDTDDGSTGMSFTDSVSYHNDSGIDMSNTGVPLTLNRMTIGNVNYALGLWSGTMQLVNGIIFNHTSAGSGSPTVTYSDSYNPNSFSGTGVIHINPAASGLLYLPRIESGSFLKTSGSGGGQMGAQIVNKIGISGTLYGEAGYNTITTDPLWPWPYEDRIKADFASVTGGARGFATGTSRDGTAQTLTKYIWEYMGNTIPCEIYDTCVTPCANLPVRINNEPPGYETIETAYAAIDANSTILLHEHIFPENLTFNKNFAVTLSGGYNCDFSSNTGYSTITGKVTIGSLGTIAMERLIIK
jgi:hypothetical protein